MPHDEKTLESEARRIVKLWALEYALPLTYAQAMALEDMIQLSLMVLVQQLAPAAPPAPAPEKQPLVRGEPCPVCGVKEYAHSLGNHLYIKHRKRLSDFPSKQASRNGVDNATWCEFCGRYVTNTVLASHMKRQHNLTVDEYRALTEKPEPVAK